MENLIVISVFAVLWIGIAYVVADMGRGREVGHRAVLWISILLSPIIGIIVALVSPKLSISSSNSVVGGDRYKVSLDNAKKAVFKGQIETAISLYQDTLYYLENDYKGMNNKAEQSRQSLMNDIREKIEELKAKQSNQ